MTTPTIFDRIEAGEYRNQHPGYALLDPKEASDEARAVYRRDHAAFTTEQARVDAMLRRDILLHFNIPETEHGGEFLGVLFDMAWDETVGDFFSDETAYVVSFERLLPLYRLYCRRLNS